MGLNSKGAPRTRGLSLFLHPPPDLDAPTTFALRRFIRVRVKTEDRVHRSVGGSHGAGDGERAASAMAQRFDALPARALIELEVAPGVEQRGADYAAEEPPPGGLIQLRTPTLQAALLERARRTNLHTPSAPSLHTAQHAPSF